MAHSEIVDLIMTRSTIGDGTKDNPCRLITEYFQKDGVFLFRVDEWERDREEMRIKTPAQETDSDVVQ